jgi:transposase
VTSSYLEGPCNEYAAFGYNRDGKRGKRQIVIGLLCDQTGRPWALEVFPGNTVDTETFGAQVQKVRQRFGGGAVTFVGDRGLLRSKQLAELAELGFHFITAITKPQIAMLLKQGVIQLSLFDQDLVEEQKLDGCYVLKTDLKKTEAPKETVQARYKDLALVEWAFRTCKTTHLEMRPIYVRKKSRTRGHALVVMLAYMLVRELAGCWAGLDLTVREGLRDLGTLTATELRVKG